MINALEACVIKSGCSGFAYQHSHGLSIYFPWAFVSPDYRNLQFAQVTGWYDFLEKHIKLTQREPRYGGIQSPQSVADLPVAKQQRRERLTKLITACRNGNGARCMQEVGDDEINREIATQFRKILARVPKNPPSEFRSAPRQPAGTARRRRRRSRNAGR